MKKELGRVTNKRMRVTNKRVMKIFTSCLPSTLQPTRLRQRTNGFARRSPCSPIQNLIVIMVMLIMLMMVVWVVSMIGSLII